VKAAVKRLKDLQGRAKTGTQEVSKSHAAVDDNCKVKVCKDVPDDSPPVSVADALAPAATSAISETVAEAKASAAAQALAKVEGVSSAQALATAAATAKADSPCSGADAIANTSALAGGKASASGCSPDGGELPANETWPTIAGTRLSLLYREALQR
jgi:hypothetical protein